MSRPPWIENSDLLAVFPTYVWKMQVRREVHEPLAERLLARLDTLRGDPAPLAAGESWQSPHALHRFEELAELAVIIEEGARAVLKFQRIGCEDLRITGCWANINAPGAVHRMHSHPNNFLSGAFYVKVQAGANTINFHDPRPQTGVIRPPVTELTSGNTDQVVVQVADGTLLLFPAWLPHSVDANASAEARVSVSFNVMFSDLPETLAQPLWGEPGPAAADDTGPAA